MSYDVSINNWSGHLGNNLFQLSSALYFGLKTKSKISFPKHPIIRKNTFDFSNSGNLKPISHDFFYNKNFFLNFKECNLDLEELENQRSEILKKFVLNLMPFEEFELPYDIVIHFRGGDVFSKNPHNSYVQCPLSYFKKILCIENPEKTLIVCEDMSNPIISILMKLDWDFSIQSSDLKKDINTILNAKVLVCGGVSTFTQALSMMSSKLEKVYYPIFESNGDDFKIRRENAIPLFHKNYINGFNWKFNDEQIKTMLNYPESDITFI